MNLNDSLVAIISRRSDMNTFFLKIIEGIDSRKGKIEYIHS